MSLFSEQEIAEGEIDQHIEAINHDTSNDFLRYVSGMFPRLVQRVEALETQLKMLAPLPLELQKANVEIARQKREIEHLMVRVGLSKVGKTSC